MVSRIDSFSNIGIISDLFKILEFAMMEYSRKFTMNNFNGFFQDTLVEYSALSKIEVLSIQEPLKVHQYYINFLAIKCKKVH